MKYLFLLMFSALSLIATEQPYKIGQPVLVHDWRGPIDLTYQDWCINGYVWRTINGRFPVGISQVMVEKKIKNTFS